MILYEISLKLKKNKLLYYLMNFARQLVPSKFYQAKLPLRLAFLNDLSNKSEINDRVNYYNKLDHSISLDSQTPKLMDLNILENPKAYHFDTYEYTRFFDKNLKANFLFGDVIHTSDIPTIQKSRPISGNNKNAVLLKLDKKRHFFFLNDPIAFSKKKDILIGRATITQPHRIMFMEKFFDHKLCDLGQINMVGGNPIWLKPKLSIMSHLQYKFILSLEGNDVATNLKWIMSSNSIAVMPKPKYETWFMEGRLIPEFHYIQINDDYSDLEAKLDYYIKHPREAQEIARNANTYTKQFLDNKKEDLISLLVLNKYFQNTEQL